MKYWYLCVFPLDRWNIDIFGKTLSLLHNITSNHTSVSVSLILTNLTREAKPQSARMSAARKRRATMKMWKPKMASSTSSIILFGFSLYSLRASLQFRFTWSQNTKSSHFCLSTSSIILFNFTCLRCLLESTVQPGDHCSLDLCHLLVLLLRPDDHPLNTHLERHC